MVLEPFNGRKEIWYGFAETEVVQCRSIRKSRARGKNSRMQNLIILAAGSTKRRVPTDCYSPQQRRFKSIPQNCLRLELLVVP